MTGESLDRAIAVTEAELAGLDMRRAGAVERLAALTEQRRATGAAGSDVGGPSVGWSAVRKVELFRSLFRGRDGRTLRRAVRVTRRGAQASGSAECARSRACVAAPVRSRRLWSRTPPSCAGICKAGRS
jgi:hypothetical protein